jgi:ADP-ribosylglycohydrolase
MVIPKDYAERVYAGVLGKIIGVYLGRPFEGWTYETIMDQLGEVNYYVHEQLNVPLIVTDDDISGTFMFLRALPDHGYNRDITAEQIGKSWLNYIVEEQTILWWGGMGNSTEHTAYLRLKDGIPAPQSGSIALNGKVVAEQIGSQIFIDGWAMVAPGDPALAADLARRAASVSHDGEAIYGAQVIAAMEAQAFVERDLNALIDTAISFIPKESVIYRMIGDIRDWHAKEPDWRKTREKIAANYGYDRYGGNVHMVPNHGLIIFSLLYGDDDFQKSLMIVNTSGWDTDCNSGNVGCILGIKNGLETIHAGPDWRGPVADRLYLPTADGGSAISDAVIETFNVVNIGHRLHGQAPVTPKNGARFHFELPGAVQGFMLEDTVISRGTVTLENVAGHSQSGTRALAMHYTGLAEGRVGYVSTPTFIPSKEVASYFERRGYRLLASPTLHAGQSVTAHLSAAADNPTPVETALFFQYYDADDVLQRICGPTELLGAAQTKTFTWTIPDTGGCPIAFIGVMVKGSQGATGSVYLDSLTWSGVPNTQLNRPYTKNIERRFRGDGGLMWKKAWVDAFDSRERLTSLDFWPEAYRLIQNRGRGMLMQGGRQWADYQVTATLTPHMCKAGGLAVRVQGLTRYYAMIVDQQAVRLVRTVDEEHTLATAPYGWTFGESYVLTLQVKGNQLDGYINGEHVISAVDDSGLLTGGGIGLVCDEGRIGCDAVAVRPITAG